MPRQHQVIVRLQPHRVEEIVPLASDDVGEGGKQVVDVGSLQSLPLWWLLLLLLLVTAVHLWCCGCSQSKQCAI
jgi:hypothetical protein